MAQFASPPSPPRTTPLFDRHPLLSKPLHVYALPDEILDGLSVRSLKGKIEGLDEPNGEDNDSGSSSSSSGSSGLLQDVLEETSLSASFIQEEEQEDDTSAQFLSNRFALRSALIWFSPSPTLLPSTQLGVYRALFPSHLSSPEAFIPLLKDLQLTKDDLEGGEEQERRWVLLMVAGGHFAGMVVSLGGKRVGKRVVKGHLAEVKVLKHRTFHRYTSGRFLFFSLSRAPKADAFLLYLCV